MIIELWGVRGSLPSPFTCKEYRERLNIILHEAVSRNLKTEQIDEFIDSLAPELKNIYGGNTSCVTVTGSKGKMFILDMGSGIRVLGDFLLSNGMARGEFNFLITHTHWDHIQGLPFFKPFYIPGNVMNFYSPIKDLEERLIYQQNFRFFPKEFHEVSSKKSFYELENLKTITTEEGLLIDYQELTHPGKSYAYRFRQNGKTFIFATDVEIIGSYFDKPDKKMDEFFENADLLLIDSQYTLDESFGKLGWGHMSNTMAVNCGVKWNVKKMVLTHHEPSYGDKKLAEIYNDAIIHLNRLGSKSPEILFATEGMKFVLE